MSEAHDTSINLHNDKIDYFTTYGDDTLFHPAYHNTPKPIRHGHKHPLTGQLEPIKKMAVAVEAKGWNKYRKGNIKSITLTYYDGLIQTITYKEGSN